MNNGDWLDTPIVRAGLWTVYMTIVLTFVFGGIAVVVGLMWRVIKFVAGE